MNKKYVQNFQKASTEASKPNDSKNGTTKPDTENTSFSGTCWYCQTKGHSRANCKPWIAAGRPSTKPAGLVSVEPSSIDRIFTQFYMMEEYVPFMSKGIVEVKDKGKKLFVKHINILRDTGASQSLLVKTLLPANAQPTHSSETVLIKGVVGDSVGIPVIEIDLKSDLVNGPVKMGLTESLTWVDFLLGNDLAGGRVSTDPHMTSVPVDDDVTDVFADKLNEFFPACATTRAQAKRNDSIIDNDCVDLSETFLNDSFNDDSNESPVFDVSNSSESKGEAITRSKLIVEQKSDPELKKL